MKNSLIFLTIIFTLFSCNDTKNNMQASAEDMLTLEGTWELMSYYNYKDNVVTDSFNKNVGYRQIKMYTPTKVMWSRKVPTDSTEWFGYGSYKFDDSTLTEVLDYGSTMMNQVIEERMEFSFELLLEKDNFTQIELDDEGNRIYSENFIRIE